MIKRLFALLIKTFQYGCVGTVLTQAILLGVLYLKGGFTPDKRWRIGAIVAGVNVEEIRKQEAESQVVLTNDQDGRRVGYLVHNRSEAIQASSVHLDSLKALLRLERQRDNVLRQEFSSWLATREMDALAGARQDLRQTFESIDPRLAKAQMAMMMEDGGMDDVLQILQSMSGRSQAKILAEFKTDADDRWVHELLLKMRDADENELLASDGLGGE